MSESKQEIKSTKQSNFYVECELVPDENTLNVKDGDEIRQEMLRCGQLSPASVDERCYSNVACCNQYCNDPFNNQLPIQQAPFLGTCGNNYLYHLPAGTDDTIPHLWDPYDEENTDAAADRILFSENNCANASQDSLDTCKNDECAATETSVGQSTKDGMIRYVRMDEQNASSNRTDDPDKITHNNYTITPLEISPNTTTPSVDTSQSLTTLSTRTQSTRDGPTQQSSRGGIAEYIMDESIVEQFHSAVPNEAPPKQPVTNTRTSKKRQPVQPWYCVSRPISEQTRDIKIRNVNRSRSINANRLIHQCRSLLEYCTFVSKPKASELLSELNADNISQLNYNYHWGDSLPNGVKGNTIRVVYQNVQRSLCNKDTASTKVTLDNLKRMETDVFMASETNCNWKQAALRNRLQGLVRQNWPMHRIAYSSSDVGLELAIQDFLPGGTCTMAFDQMGMRVIKAGEDESGLGRWSYLTLEGQDGRRLTFITGYRICKGVMKGTTTSCIQQRRVLNNQEMRKGVATSTPDAAFLRQKFVEDLTQFILALKEDGHAIILGVDANETMEEASKDNSARQGSITHLLEATGLQEVFLARHNECLDSTTTTPGRCIDRLAVSGVHVQRATLLRANEPAVSDHLAMVIDIDLQILFNNPCSTFARPKPRKLTSTNPDAVTKYIGFIKKQFTEHRIIERCNALRESSLGEFTERHRRQLYALDSQITEIMKGAENQCSTKRPLRNLWSPALKKAGQEVTYWRRRLRINGLLDEGTRDLGASLDLPATVQVPMDEALCNFYLTIALKTYRGIQINQREYREKFLKQQAKAYADKGNGDVSNALRQIRQRERLKQDYASIQRAYGKTKQGLTTLDIPNPTTGGRTLLTDAEEIHSYLLKRNEAHYSQATFTPFGDAGPGYQYIDPTNPESDQYIDAMLEGVFEPWESASPYLREWLQELKCTVEKEMSADLYFGEFKQLFQTIPENTASSVSDRHYGHYKVLSKLDDDTYIRVLFDIVDIAFRTHSPLPRWKYATQLMLEKGKGPGIENLRIIQLLKADMNWLLRYLWGRKLNYHAQQEGAYSEDQYAAPGKLCCSAILNKVIFFDLLRQMRQCGALMDNDATAAFDRVLPALCVVTCRQLGMPKSAQRFFFQLLRQMEYTVTTAHGMSLATYSANANPKVPGQGVIQGGGASQPNFNSQQHPVIKSVEKNCIPAVFQHASPLKQRFRRWVGGFSDDMGLFINELGVKLHSRDSREASLPIALRVRNALQNNIIRYEAYFNAAGGALNVKKCFYYLINFVWTGTQWQYQSNSEMNIDPITIIPTTLDNSGTPQTVAWLEANDAQRTLGTFISPDGSFFKQLQVLHDKLSEWKRSLKNMHEGNRRAKWLSYQNVFLRKLLYPLIGHSFENETLVSLQQPIDAEILHIMGLNEHFPRAVLRAPLLYGGLGCTTLHGQHVIDKLVLFMHHIRENKRIAESLKASMSTTQLECGVSKPFFALDPEIWYPLVTPTWTTHLWKNCKLQGIDIRCHNDVHWVPAAVRQNDICIMEVAAQMYHGVQLFQINQCRLFLQVTYLSDIVSVDGKRILLAYYNGKGHQDTGRSTRLAWPPVGTLPQQYWAVWKEFLERWSGTSLRLQRRLGSWYEGGEILTRICFFMYDNRLILQNRNEYLEYLPFTARSRTRFSITSRPVVDTAIFTDLDKIQAVDISIKHDSIYVVSRHSVGDVIPNQRTGAATSIIDLYNGLPCELQRMIGYIEWPDTASLEKIASAIKAGQAIGASDGSVRKAAFQATQAWILHAADGSEIIGRGPVDGSQDSQTSHRAELQGQAALFVMLSLFIQFYNLVNCKISTFCDNLPVVRKMKKGWGMFRLRHTKGPDSDIQAVLKSVLDDLRRNHGMTYTTEWVKSHQDKDTELCSLPRPVALNVRMDEETKLAYALPQRWLTQEYVPVLAQEGCAVYLGAQKITSSIQSRLLEHWHSEEAKRYLADRHGISSDRLHTIHWPALRFALKKFSHQRRVTVVKALHRHLPTQAKLFQQGRVAMSSRCPRCLQVDETAAHVYCCQNADATKQRLTDWKVLIKQLTKNHTCSLILRAWKEHLMPLLAIPTTEALPAMFFSVTDEASDILEYAIKEQNDIGWDKLLLGLCSPVWRTLQDHVDAENPKAPRRTADDWINASVHQMIKFSLRCWKHRNVSIHGATKRDQQEIALRTARDRIMAIYANPPTLAPQYRPIQEVSLSQRLRLPLQAAEQWLSLVNHQIKVTGYTLKRLLKQHIPMEHHIGNMQKVARQQRYARRQPTTSSNSHSRKVQSAVKQMRQRLYSSKAKHAKPAHRHQNKGNRRQHSRSQRDASKDIDEAVMRYRSSRRYTQRYHPP